MARPTLPKLPIRSPSARGAIILPPPPSLSPSQSEEFDRASAGLERCVDERKLLDQEPDGGDPDRRAALQAELEEYTVAFTSICERLALKLNVANEEELALMNRAQRRTYEATMRKMKKAKGLS